jgi:aspartate/methionine/tyrosine aminotransferase
MDLPPFLLDHWLAQHEFCHPPIRYNLGSSTGPAWTLGALEALADGAPDLRQIPLTYGPPEGSLELRRAIAENHGADPDWVIVTTGASEALSILFCLASSANRNIVLPAPGFPAFSALAGAWGLAVKSYSLLREEGFRQCSENVLRAVDQQTALVLVNTPHNPTGSIFPAEEVRHLAGELSSRGVPLIVDEVYHPLYFAEEQPSAAGAPNVIVIGDMSKALSLAGSRIGWIIDADDDRRKRMIDARSYFTISSSPLLEAIAAHALRNRSAILKRLKEVASRNCSLLQAELADVSDLIDWVPPSGGTTAFPWFIDGRDSRPFCERLAERQVLVVPGDCFGAPSHVRLGYAAEADGFGAALEIMLGMLRA